MNPQPYWYQPYTWTSASTTNVWIDPWNALTAQTGGIGAPTPAPRPARRTPAPESDPTNVGWLRARVAEICDLAPL